MSVTIISDTIQEFAGVRFYRCGHYFQNKGRRLHRAVWESVNGPVPRGHHIHHVDGDRNNNRLDNLECRTAASHLSEHMSAPARAAVSRSFLARAIAAAPKWHASEAGHAWHVQHARALLAVHTERSVEKVCAQCNASFRVPALLRTSSRFCSNNCKSAWRRASGVDNVQRACAVCGDPFTVNRYQRTQTCGRRCSVALP